MFLGRPRAARGQMSLRWISQVRLGTFRGRFWIDGFAGESRWPQDEKVSSSYGGREILKAHSAADLFKKLRVGLPFLLAYGWRECVWLFWL